MGCPRCDDTGWISEHEPETGFVDAPCPDCRGRDGEEPDIVTEGHDALTEMEAYAFASRVGIVVLEADASSGHSKEQQ